MKARESPKGSSESFWLEGNLAVIKAVYDCVREFSEVDFTEDLKNFDVRTLIVHGDDDQIVPIEASAHLSSRLAPQATLKVYPGAPHGWPITHHQQLGADILAFIPSWLQARPRKDEPGCRKKDAPDQARHPGRPIGAPEVDHRGTTQARICHLVPVSTSGIILKVGTDLGVAQGFLARFVGGRADGFGA